MARDLKAGLAKLSVADNFNPNEFTWKEYTLDLTSVMGLTITQTRGYYFKVGNLCTIMAAATFFVNLGSVVDSKVYISLPFPHAANRPIRGISGAFQSGVQQYPIGLGTSELVNDRIGLQLTDGEGHAINHYNFDLTLLSVSFIYEVDPAYWRASNPVTPGAFTPQADSREQWTDYPASVSAQAPMTVSSYGVSHCKFKRVGDEVTLSVELSATLGGAANSFVDMTLPIPGAAINQAGACRINSVAAQREVGTVVITAASPNTATFVRNASAVFSPVETILIRSTFTYICSHQ